MELAIVVALGVHKTNHESKSTSSHELSRVNHESSYFLNFVLIKKLNAKNAKRF